jgi:uncharacterized protein (TIGR00369 family)
MQQRTHADLDAELCGEPSELEDGVAVVDLVTSHRMRADGHGLVHGGFVFGLADHAAMLAINHPNVVLGSANIRFDRPVIVGERLRARARVRAVQGKKHIVDVEVERPQQGSPEATTPEIVMRGELRTPVEINRPPGTALHHEGRVARRSRIPIRSLLAPCPRGAARHQGGRLIPTRALTCFTPERHVLVTEEAST